MVIDKETRGSTVAFLAQINSVFTQKSKHDFYCFNNIIDIFVIVVWVRKYTLLTKLKKLIITKKEYLQLYLRVFKKEISRNEY